MKQVLQKLLYKGGVFKSYRGYTFFEEAVFLVYENPKRLFNIGKEVYLPISLDHNTTTKVVEKDIRTIRDVFMRNNGIIILKEMGYDFYHSRYPYPRELIEIFASYLNTLNQIPDITS